MPSHAPSVPLGSPQRLALALAAWSLVVVAGFGLLLEYSVTGGAPAQAPARWPEGTGIPRLVGSPRLVLFAHPRCPCTRAMLAELARLATEVGPRFTAAIQFYVPAGRAPRWAHTDLWRLATGIPGAQVSVDVGGVEAERFGAATSGQLLVYGARGELRFAGGLTPSRGHEGESIGKQAVAAMFLGEQPPAPRGRVFGCPLSPTPTTPSSRLEAAERRWAGALPSQEALR